MTRLQKIDYLLEWNKTHNTTFQERAKEARFIVTADEIYLDSMIQATQMGAAI